MLQKNLLWIIVVFLLVLNTSTLLFLVWERRTPAVHPGNRFDDQVIRTLQLDEQQQQQFEVLKRAHHEEILSIDQSMHGLFIDYFSLLEDSTRLDSRDSLEHLLAAAYDRKVQITYAHFRELKAICRPEQQAHFKELLPQLMQVISPPEKKEALPPREME